MVGAEDGAVVGVVSSHTILPLRGTVSSGLLRSGARVLPGRRRLSKSLNPNPSDAGTSNRVSSRTSNIFLAWTTHSAMNLKESQPLPEWYRSIHVTVTAVFRDICMCDTGQFYSFYILFVIFVYLIPNNSIAFIFYL